MKDLDIRHDWCINEVLNLFEMPFNDLLYKAQSIHRKYWNPNQIQHCTIVNFKTGACPENCRYCSQSAFYNTGLKKEPLWDIKDILNDAIKAKQNGAQRYCMGAAWRNVNDRDLSKLCEIISRVKALGLETCATFGMLSKYQAEELHKAGLEYYNHNLDTSREHYHNIVTTRTYEDRLETINIVRNSGIKVCCGGIFGMGENIQDRASMLVTLANLEEHPESTPINLLVKIRGTPLENCDDVPTIDFVKSIAVARIMLPKTFIRLSGGRLKLSDEGQALCFLAGANSIHFGEKLLTTPNPSVEKDKQLFNKLGLKPYEAVS